MFLLYKFIYTCVHEYIIVFLNNNNFNFLYFFLYVFCSLLLNWHRYLEWYAGMAMLFILISFCKFFWAPAISRYKKK